MGKFASLLGILTILLGASWGYADAEMPADLTVGSGPTGTVFKWDRQECSSWTDDVNGNKIDFCLLSSDSIGATGRTLYAFHGMTSSGTNICARFSHQVYDFEQVGTISHVICPSFGPHWIFDERGRRESFERFQHYVQNNYGASSTIAPVLYGESMGGFNAIKLAQASEISGLKFQKVGVACPAVFSRRLPAVTKHIKSLIPNALFDGLDVNTCITIVQNSPYFDSAVYPELMLFANTEDELGVVHFSILKKSHTLLNGLYRGTKDFYHSQQKKGAAVHFRDIPGGHCVGLPLGEMIDFLGK